MRKLDYEIYSGCLSWARQSCGLSQFGSAAGTWAAEMCVERMLSRPPGGKGVGGQLASSTGLWPPAAVEGNPCLAAEALSPSPSCTSFTGAAVYFPGSACYHSAIPQR